VEKDFQIRKQRGDLNSVTQAKEPAMSEFFNVSRDGALTTVAFTRTQGLNILSSAVLRDLSEAWTVF